MKKLKVKQKGYSILTNKNVDDNDVVVASVLKLLPATILVLIAVLSLEDREVLAYMITRLMKTTNPISLIEDGKKKCTSFNNNPKKNLENKKKSLFFQCGCFDCYTNYWFKWDSSPNRELIHQAIEAYEEHLSKNEKHFNNRGRNKKKKNKNKNKNKTDKMGLSEKPQLNDKNDDDDDGFELCGGSDEGDLFIIEEDYDDCKLEEEEEEVIGKLTETVVVNVMDDDDDVQVEVMGLCCSSSHKGFARKVLPDVLELFNSRLWSLWGTAV
ncbi:hypothetical protein AQUCO_04000113v1 [Aquilegia coerulea]|uniref:Uncharacterized protein n=1 Tax=Aquilegia coerulea TaxID=218851 RepID=A0A2G5CRB7_AQUCA|nr:hypothetical protein AQUCO_04000113v1 [Aquilegia coerulea]